MARPPVVKNLIVKYKSLSPSKIKENVEKQGHSVSDSYVYHVLNELKNSKKISSSPASFKKPLPPKYKKESLELPPQEFEFLKMVAEIGTVRSCELIQNIRNYVTYPSLE